MTTETMGLTVAIKLVTEDYDWPIDQQHDPIVAVLSTRELSAEEVRSWELDGELEAAYVAVIEASLVDLASALRSLITQ